jgi:hypothetical protein
LPLFKLRERAIDVYWYIRSEGLAIEEDSWEMDGFLWSLLDLTEEHAHCIEPEENRPCHYLTHATIFDESGSMLALENITQDTRVGIVGCVGTDGRMWISASFTTRLYLDFGFSGLWLQVGHPFPAWIRVKSASKLYTPLFSATLAKAKLAYAIHDELSDRPAQAGQEASFDWLLAQLGDTCSLAEIENASAFVYSHLHEEHSDAPCIAHIGTLTRDQYVRPRSAEMMVPHWANTEHRLVWMAQKMPRKVLIGSRLGMYAEPPEQRVGKRKGDVLSAKLTGEHEQGPLPEHDPHAQEPPSTPAATPEHDPASGQARSRGRGRGRVGPASA